MTEPLLDGPPRPVEVGWHPVGGLAGKWFAEETGLGKMITDKINRYPDPTQHWAVLVGEFAHQLWMVSRARRPLSRWRRAADARRTRASTSYTPTNGSSARSGGRLASARRASTTTPSGGPVTLTHALDRVDLLTSAQASRSSSPSGTRGRRTTSSPTTARPTRCSCSTPSRPAATRSSAPRSPSTRGSRAPAR